VILAKLAYIWTWKGTKLIMTFRSIAIDGPAGAGKSTISKAVAKQLEYVYIDTGAMYRAVALYAIERGIDTHNADRKLAESLGNIEIDIRYIGGTQHIFLNGADVSEEIRRPDVSIGASDVAVVSEVRIKLVELQRILAQKANVVMDGRDIGTYVLPNADVKIFLTASADERAKRRYAELKEKGVDCDFEQVKADMIYRDNNDSSREFAPLKQADDAVLIDTGGKTLQESIDMISDCVRERL